MDFYEAINCKGWTKSFVMDELQPDLEGKIINYTKYLRGIEPDRKANYVILRYKDMKRRHRELFSNKAPYFLVIYLDDLQKQLMNAGYLMGQMALYLMTKEIGSCILGVEKIRKAEDVDLLKNAVVLFRNGSAEPGTWMAIMAFGKPERRLRLFPKAVSKLFVEKKCIYKGSSDPNISTILNATAHVPSKLFLSPFRYVISENRVHVYVKNEAMMTSFQRNVVLQECGIMLAYLGMKAEELWMTMNIKQVQRLSEKELNHFQYLVSLVFESQ